LREALRSQTLKDASARWRRRPAKPRQQVYRRALALAKERRDDV